MTLCRSTLIISPTPTRCRLFSVFFQRGLGQIVFFNGDAQRFPRIVPSVLHGDKKKAGFKTWPASLTPSAASRHLTYMLLQLMIHRHTGSHATHRAFVFLCET